MMAKIEFNVPNENLAEVANALAWAGGYQDKIIVDNELVDNPVTKGQFAKIAVIKYVQNSVKEYRNMIAQQAVQTDINIT
jgi:hypothetical protein